MFELNIKTRLRAIPESALYLKLNSQEKFYSGDFLTFHVLFLFLRLQREPNSCNECNVKACIIVFTDASSKGIFGACQTDSSKYFLVLDPHFVLSKNTEILKNENLIEQGWAKWVQLQDFSSSSFYNLCLPQIKNTNIL